MLYGAMACSSLSVRYWLTRAVMRYGTCAAVPRHVLDSAIISQLFLSINTTTCQLFTMARWRRLCRGRQKTVEQSYAHDNQALSRAAQAQSCGVTWDSDHTNCEEGIAGSIDPGIDHDKFF